MWGLKSLYYTLLSYYNKGNLLIRLEILRIPKLESSLIEKNYEKESLILSLIYFRTGVSKGWVPILSPASKADRDSHPSRDL